MMITMLFLQIPALALREFFNMLSGNAQLGLNLWSLVALLFLAELGSMLGIYGLIATNVPFFMNVMTLLRKNLLSTSCAARGLRPCPIHRARPSAASAATPSRSRCSPCG